MTIDPLRHQPIHHKGIVSFQSLIWIAKKRPKTHRQERDGSGARYCKKRATKTFKFFSSGILCSASPTLFSIVVFWSYKVQLEFTTYELKKEARTAIFDVMEPRPPSLHNQVSRMLLLCGQL